jgi:hypothetical protein
MEGERDREIERKKGNDEDKCKKESAVEIKSSGQNKWACISIKQTNSPDSCDLKTTHTAQTQYTVIHPQTQCINPHKHKHISLLRSDPIRFDLVRRVRVN